MKYKPSYTRCKTCLRSMYYDELNQLLCGCEGLTTLEFEKFCKEMLYRDSIRASVERLK